MNRVAPLQNYVGKTRTQLQVILPNLTSLRNLRLCDTDFLLAGLRFLTNLRSLKLHNCNLYHSTLDARQLTNLEKLVCNTLIDLPLLITCTNLTSLKIHHASTIPFLPKLRKLSIQSSFTSDGYISHLTTLESLKIIWPETTVSGECFRFLTNLTYLFMHPARGQNQFQPESLTSLTKLKTLSLCLREGEHHKYPFHVMTSLTEVNLQGPPDLSKMDLNFPPNVKTVRFSPYT